MELTSIHNIDIMKKFIRHKTEVCYFCNTITNLEEAYFEDKIIDVCCLCYIIINNKKEQIDSCLLWFTSKLTQTLIIKKTRKYYEEHGCIPLPTELDPNMCLISLPVYIFSQFTNKDIYDDFCVFFTSKVQDKLDDQFNIGVKKLPVYKYFELPNYKFTDKENKLI